MKYDEKGSKFYIILRGSVSVRIPSLVSKRFSFRGLLKMLVDNEEWIIENNKFEIVLKLIQKLMPSLVKNILSYKFNFKLARDLLNSSKV